MRTSRKSSNLVGLDVEAGSVAASEVVVNGSPRLGHIGIAPLGPGVTHEGEVADPAALGEILKELFAERKLPRRVRIGIANQRVVVRTLRLPLIEKRDELETAIRFQAAEQIPMPLDQAVLDWQVLEPDAETRAGRQMDVVVVAARRETVNGLINAVRAAGLKPIGIDVAAFAMIRALTGQQPPSGPGGELSYEERVAAEDDGVIPLEPARLFCNLGDVTNLAVARGPNCLFTRVSSFGIEGIAQQVAERSEVSLEQAREWLAHVGLVQPLEEVDGDPEIAAVAREALIEGTEKLAGELRLSLDFYGTQEGAVAIEEVVACGPGTAIDGLAAQLERELGYAFRVGRPAALADLDPVTAARLTLPYGLALEA